ncbi:MAG: PSD1 domain-containing protein [Planctomycetales bacterium]|nr:PSD1 domain-containing protein [Planctomycetales bacterium]
MFTSRPPFSWFVDCIVAVPLVLGAAASAPAAEATPAADGGVGDAAQIEFFEKEVRPLLVSRCIECHGEQLEEASLRLDSREAVLRGSENGSIVVEGDPSASRLIEAVQYHGDVQMPPDGPMEEAEVTTLVRWVRGGLPWGPSQIAPDGSAADVVASTADSHWAFQPITRPDVPEIDDSDWPQGDIDRFVLSRLRTEGITPSAPADRRTWLRRVTFDLTGLPPTMEEIDAFERDGEPGAYDRVVDRLLASPLYGQRWGRHWLDVARYADTKGYVFTESTLYPYAYTYRDYVIAALNDDMPYNEFLVEQIAADLLPEDGDNTRLAALGFLTLGRRFNKNIHDIIDDRIDVVTRGLMGLTVSCARCHDHKYDPIPTADYYSLYGVFASCTEPNDPPLIGTPAENEAYVAYEKQAAEIQGRIDALVDQELAAIPGELRSQVTAYLLYVVENEPEKVLEKDGAALSLGRDEVKPQIAERWRGFIGERSNDDPVFGPWKQLATIDTGDFATAAGQTIANLSATEGTDKPSATNSRVVAALATAMPASMSDVARVYGELLASADEAWQQSQQVESGEPPKTLDDPAIEQLRQVLYAEKSPTVIDRAAVPDLLDRASKNTYNQTNQELGNLKANSPVAPPRAMALLDQETPHEPHIFVRGSVHNQGDQVPRRFLSLIAGDDAPPFTQGSGRLEMAQAVVADGNPLTARVAVNRIWQQHFGHGLVRTSGDFGTRGESPTHPELLDFLTDDFRRNGWSQKRLHRMIVLSATYRQASDDRPDCAAADPENRLLWRMNRHRLEYEALRDALLAAAGDVDTSLGGRSVDLFKEPFSRRRSVYGFIDRQELPQVLRVFDFASPDQSIPQRPSTTVPQQALYLMNSPFVIEQAKRLSERPEVVEADSSGAAVRALYACTLSRPPSDEELAAVVAWLDNETALSAEATNAPADDDKHETSAIARLAQALLMTSEFAWID